MSFDTTASNTGVFSGACVSLEEELGKQLLYLACRHHCLELHIKHVALNVGRPTKGNEDALFKRFRESWNDIMEAGVDQEKLVKLDYSCVPEIIVREGEKALIFLSKCLLENTFARGDYRELCELAVVFLGGTVKGFQFRLPG